MRILFHALDSNPDAWLSALRAALPDAELRVWHEGDTAPADYAVVWKPPVAMLQPRADLKAIFNIGAGVDAILQHRDALPNGVSIVRLDDAGMGVQMAEYVTHAVLRYFRRFDEFDAQAGDRTWRFLKPHDKETFAVGVLGLGVLGSRIVDAIAHFGFPLHGWSRTQKTIPGVVCHAGDAGLDTFLRTSRVVVCVLPLTDQTRGILCRDNLAKLPQGAYVINVARGAHIVEADLLELVHSRHIAAATLDVFQQEPLPSTHPFWHEPRITVTPHIAALTLRDDSVRQIAGKIRALQRGEPIAGLVDQQKGY